MTVIFFGIYVFFSTAQDTVMTFDVAQNKFAENSSESTWRVKTSQGCRTPTASVATGYPGEMRVNDFDLSFH